MRTVFKHHALAEEHTTLELLVALREHVISSRRQMLRSILCQAQERAEIASNVDLDLAAAQLFGSYYALAFTGHPIPPDWPERIVEQVLTGLLPKK